MKKSLDCVAMKRKIQADLYAKTKGLTNEELLTYYRNSVESGPLADWWRKAKAAQENKKKKIHG